MQLRDEYSTLKKDAYRHLADLKHDREELRQKGAEVNDELSAAKKIRINLDLLKKELEVKENELELERAKVGEEQLHCLQTKKRYEALIKSRQTKEMLDKRRKDALPTQGRKKVRRVSAEGAPSSDDESGDDDKASNTTHLSATFRSEGTRSQSERPLAVFGSQLSKPSRLNRPVAPRRDRAKLSQFTPKRSKVQRPMGGVGARSRIR
ncbi:unnamed protein product [Chondrus crispus]|uniref:Uncharacterized protein n=1 Tax=Chondrus crispus TaxID=2769 RepID=R7QAW8_CHOCR|nr:unnamed protein product [Chondrus crispus]CDF35657.1 unnamed protein product [Chondrus crispus]|eukprot:XP_005715476.1 unnamed protein product [Chondrus crispus]